MCVALVRGMDRLERHYLSEAETLMSRRDTKDNENPHIPPFVKGGMWGFSKQKLGIDLRVSTKSESQLISKIKNVDVGEKR